MKKLGFGWVDAVIGFLTLAVLGYALAVYHELPARLANDFSFDGEVQGTQDKLTFYLVIGIMMVVLPWIMKLLRLIDPRKENYAKFMEVFELFRLLFALILQGAFLFIILYNKGYDIPVSMSISLMLGVLWIFLGNYFGRIRFNYFIGIKTPWTLADEEVWRRTHRMAGPLWVAAGILWLATAFLSGEWVAWITAIGIGISVLVPFVYSFICYRSLRKN